MDLYNLVCVALFFHFTFYLLDTTLKSWFPQWFQYLQEHVGLSIKPLQVQFTTTAFIRPLSRISLGNSIFHRQWFNVGVYVVLIALVPSIIIVIVSIIQSSTRLLQPNTVPDDQPLLQPMVPGINVFAGDIVYYFISFLIASVFHEIGHAAAAVREGVSMESFGVLLFFVLPGAFVVLPPSALTSLPPFRRLKVLCGGVWHNIVLIALAIALGSCSSVIFSPIYRHNSGAIVTSLTENSPARGSNGLVEGQVITNINGCPVHDVQTWHDCLLHSVTHAQSGYCLPDSLIAEMDETVHHTADADDGSVTCCAANNRVQHLCFELLADQDNYGSQPLMPYSCLPARTAIAHSTRACTISSQCPAEYHCLAPSLGRQIRLLQIVHTPYHSIVSRPHPLTHHDSSPDHDSDVKSISRKPASVPDVTGNVRSEMARKILSSDIQDKDYTDDHHHDSDVPRSFNDVLYLGTVPDLYRSVSVSEYIPKFWFVPNVLVEHFLSFCDFIIKFSGALAILNLMPCVYLDGHHIAATLLEWALAKRVSSGAIYGLQICITAVGTSILVVSVALSFASLL